MTKRMTRAAAVAQVADILMLVRDGVDLDDLVEAAQDEVRRRKALTAAIADWPKLNEERAAGDVEGVEAGAAPLSWDEYIDYCIGVGEWEEQWGHPPAPAKQ